MLNVNAALTAPTTAAQPPPLAASAATASAAAASAAPADLTAPIDPAVASTSHVPASRSIDATVEVTWSGAFDFGSGIDGFSFSWDTRGHDHSRTRSRTPRRPSSKTISAPLAPGTYWFHLRTRDNAGNWSAGTHAGPYVIAAGGDRRSRQRCTVPKAARQDAPGRGDRAQARRLQARPREAGALARPEGPDRRRSARRPVARSARALPSS